MFHSTRGDKLVSSPKAILDGLASDGGLYVIDKIPALDYHELLNDNYQMIAAKVLNKFFPEFSVEELKKEIDEAYANFDIEEVVGMKNVADAYFLELFHGPTLAFKDQALVLLPRLMKLSKEKLGNKENITILTATSGDTGGAALNGFKDIPGISIVVLYPNGGVSPVQEAQMLSFESENAKPIAITGNFDDCQSFVKDFFKNHKNYNLSSANSINIARLAPQIVYYFYAYAYLVKNGIIKDGEKINFDVPTGNFGNIFAGFYAKNMGLPIKNLICASNKNCVLTDFFLNGNYNKNREFFKTNSPSMDILISSNLERLLYYANKENTESVAKLMNELNTKGTYDFKNPYDFFFAYSTDEKRTMELIKETYDKNQYVMDPHTSVAYNAYLEYKKETKDDAKTVIISTASPFKFPQTVLESFGMNEEDPFKAVTTLSKEFNLEVPAVLNYKKKDRTIVKLNECEKYVEDLITCLKSK